MLLHSHSVGLLPHAFKHRIPHAQHTGCDVESLSWTQAPAVQLSILVISNHNADRAPSQNACSSPYPGSVGDVGVVDRYQLSPGGGKPGVVDKLADEALQSLVELKSLAAQVGDARNKLDGSVSHHWERQDLAPTLEKLSTVQSETNTSIDLSKMVIRSHRDFCLHMHETLQHAAAARDHHLAHDSSVIVAGRMVSESLTALGTHIMAVQRALHDVAQELHDLGKKGQHHIMHPKIHHLWTKIRPVLIDVVKTTMLVISGIGKVLGLFHPVAHIIGEGAGKVHEYLDKHFSSCVHGHNMDPPPGEHDHYNSGAGSDVVLQILQSICDDMPKHIQHVQDQLQDCYTSMEKPMLEVEEQLMTHCIRVDKQDAQDAANMWGELRERLDSVIVEMQC